MAKWYEKLSEPEIEFIRVVHSNKDVKYDERIRTLMDRFNKSERGIRLGISGLGFTKEHPNEESSEQYEEAKKKVHSDDKETFFITWAQNNTPVHPKFLQNIKAYAKKRDAELLVIAGRYRNPTSLSASRSSKNKEKTGEVQWSNLVEPYLTANRHNIHKYLNILADVRVMPTAETPLSGFEGLSGLESTVIGHPKQNMKPMPVLQSYPHKVLFSTGAVTMPNYTDSKAGKKGEFHHTFGFLVVEKKDEENFHIRNVVADDTGEFNDLIYNVKNGKVTSSEPLEAIVLGDLHSGVHDVEVSNQTTKLFRMLKPKKIVLHDVFDAASVSHHNEKDPFYKYELHKEGKDKVKEELQMMNSILGEISEYGETYVVRSNHDEHLDKYLKERDWKKDLTNAKEYMELSLALLSGEAPKGALPYIIERKNPQIHCLDVDESLNIKGVECGLHGDRGANGSRGSIMQFKRLNVRTITGHSHCITGGFSVQHREKGWVEVRSLSVGDEILSYDPSTGCNEWNVIDEYNQILYDGLLISINGNGFHQTFTSGHNLMMDNGDYIPATEAIITRSPSELPLTAGYTNSYGFEVPEKIIRQIVAIAADASVNKYRIRFHLKKDRKIDRVKELFGEDVYTSDGLDGSTNCYIKTSSDTIKEIMKVKDICTQKRLSNEVLDWSPNSLEILQDELKYWDGTFETGNNGRQYSTVSKKEQNIVLSALNRIGYSCKSYKKKSDDTYVITWCSDRNFKRSSELKDHKHRFGGWGLKTMHKNTTVYGLGLKNKCYWIKSGTTGDVSLTGNSPWIQSGAYSVGTSTKLKLNYNKGLSSWMQAHVTVDNLGKRQMLLFIDGGFTTLF